MGSQVVNASAGMVTNVLYARHLSLRDVGIIALINALSIIVSVLLDRGMGSWVTRTLANSTVGTRAAILYLLRGAVPVAIGIFVVSCVAIFSGSYIPEQVRQVIILTIALCITFWFFQLSLSLTQGLNMPSLRSWGILLNGVLTALVTYFALAAGYGLEVCVLVSAAVYGALGLGILVTCWIKRDPEPTESMSYKTSIKGAVPLFASNLVTYAVSSGDILLCSALLSAEQVGRYQIAKKIAQAVSLPLVSVLPMFLGRLSRMAPEQRWSAVKRLLIWASALFMSAIIAGIIAFPSMIPFVFGEEYTGLAGIAVSLIAAFAFLFARDLLSTLTNANGFFKRALFSSSTTALTLALASLGLHGVMTLALYSLLVTLSYMSGVMTHLIWLNGLTNGAASPNVIRDPVT